MDVPLIVKLSCTETFLLWVVLGRSLPYMIVSYLASLVVKDSSDWTKTSNFLWFDDLSIYRGFIQALCFRTRICVY